MTYEEAKKRVTLQYYYGCQYVFGSDRLSKAHGMEYNALLAEFGEPNEDTYYEDLDALCAQLAGCLDPAPQWVCDEVAGLSEGGTWHQVYVEHMTNSWLDSAADDRSAAILYEVYTNDLRVHPGLAPSCEGFRAWVDEITGHDDQSYVEDLMSHLPA
jgi:hypothetical protein